MNLNRLLKDLEKDEKYMQKPYRCTANKLTLGIGRNIEDVGITYSEAIFLLKNDVAKTVNDLRNIFDNFDNFPDNIQEVLANMRFQLGPNRFRGFKKFIVALDVWDIPRAAKEMEDSLWFSQTQKRAERLKRILLNGFDNDR